MTALALGTWPIKITYENLTFYEVRILGVFVGAFCDLAISLGVQADALMEITAEELFEGEQTSAEQHDEAKDRIFKATWRQNATTTHTRYAAWSDGKWTEVFELEEDLGKALESASFRI
ncbi:hypothetical protein HFO84_11250 [Rhizobium leguminosarum]|uniref:hypothetical protein n=1 Tax=Rhizobium leguminosarum TaxID=384 RepID=UPI001C9436F5|nr:hypothetical protein [Rhizobium leguminosarum]MBY5477910.1 hypothetical protein [Rhizobium leguminosarum]